MENHTDIIKGILENISKETLAGKLQVSTITVTRWLNGTTPNFATRKLLHQIANGYHKQSLKEQTTSILKQADKIREIRLEIEGGCDDTEV